MKLNKNKLVFILIGILGLVIILFFYNKKTENNFLIENRDNFSYCDNNCMHNLTEEECLKRNGSWGRHGIDLGYDECNLKTSDFNKSCKKSSDCDGHCLCKNKIMCKLNNGRCSEYRMKFGCFNYLNEYGELEGICQD